jgi:hypothetical protein
MAITPPPLSKGGLSVETCVIAVYIHFFPLSRDTRIEKILTNYSIDPD